MSAIDALFVRLRQNGRKAFMPFVTAGDPDLDFTAAVIRELVARGSSICEVGIPYSDPVADGPIIQASYTRALDHQVRLAGIFKMLRSAASDLGAPLVTMVSYAIVYRHGLESYVREAKEAGVAGAIVPDLPIEEAGPLAAICRREDFSLIQLITPTTPRDRALRIADETTGFIYYVSVTGITGERTQLPQDVVEQGDLASLPDTAAGVHRLRDQPAGTRPHARPRGRWTDRWLGDRSPRRRSGRKAPCASVGGNRPVRG